MELIVVIPGSVHQSCLYTQACFALPSTLCALRPCPAIQYRATCLESNLPDVLRAACLALQLSQQCVPAHGSLQKLDKIVTVMASSLD